MSEFGEQPFSTMRSYDVPMTLIGMTLDNELSVRGVQKALFDPAALSPKERETVVQRIKDRVGGGTVGDALVDVATNPLAWLAFATSAPVGTALKQAGRGIFPAQKRISSYVMERLPFLYSIGGGTAYHVYEGTKVVPILQQIEKGTRALDHGLAHRLEPLLQKVKRSAGLAKGLDIEDYAKGTPERETVERLMFALQGSIEGWDKQTTSVIAGLVRKSLAKGKNVVQRFKTKTVVHDPLVAKNLDNELGQWEGARELRDALVQEMKDRWKLLIGRDDLPDFAVDTDKAQRLFRTLTAPVVGKGAMSNVGMDLIEQVMGPKTLRLIQEGKITEANFKDLLVKIIEEPMKGSRGYFPRNLWREIGATEPESVLMARKRGNTLQTTRQLIPRAPHTSSLVPDDLDRVAAYFGAGPAWAGEMARSMRVLDLGLSKKMRRLNPFEAMERYFDQSGRTWSFAIQNPDEKVLQSIAETDKFIPQGPLATRRKTVDLRGGMSLGDHLQEAYEYLRMGDMGPGKFTFAQNMLRDVHLPLVMGKSNIEHASSYAAMQSTKAMMGAFANSKLGEAIAGTGKWGANFIEGMKREASKELTTGGSRRMTGNLARYLYITHLGVNLSSAMLNSMQPFLLAGPHLGIKSLMKGYLGFFEDFGKYMEHRAKQGFAPQTFAARREGIKKFFRWTDFDGEDLIGIAPDFEESLDALSRTGSALGRAAEKESLFWNYPLKFFEKAEWMNRIVVANAVEDRYLRAGRNILSGADRTLMARDIRRMVSETQFGGDLMSTPTMFLGQGPFGRMMNNPLFRQFATFYTRMAMAPALFSPRVAGGVREVGFFGVPLFKTTTPAVAAAFDMMRGLGYSAIIYEVGKNVLGADLSPSLYASSVAGVVGGDRFLEDGNEWIRLPPIVSIPVDLTKGLIGGDYELLKRTIPRLLPGGVAASRALGVFPDLPEGVGGGLQKTFVDYNHPTEDGRLATYKSDGTLLGYFSRMEVYGKALGLDLGKFNEQSEFDHFMLKNQEEKRDYARRAAAALLSNQSEKARAIGQEFEKRFGYPLRLSKEQIKAAREVRETPRTERILSNMPPEMRGVYQQIMQKSRVGQRVASGPGEVVEPELGGIAPAESENPFQVFEPFQLPGLP